MVMDSVIIAVSGWIAIRTLSAVGRTVPFWFPLIVLLLIVIMPFSFRNISLLTALIPSTHVAIVPWVKTVYATWYLDGHGALVSTLTPIVAWKRPVDAYITGTLAIFGQASILLTFCAIDLGTVGPDAVGHLYWPLVYVFSLVSVRIFFFKGIGVFIMIIWASSMVGYLANHLFCFTWGVVSQVKNPIQPLRWGVVGLSAMFVIGAGLLVPSILAKRYALFHWVTPESLLWSTASLPFVWLLSSRYRCKREDQPS